MSESIDLDELERKALAAADTWWIRGRDTLMVVGDGPRLGSAGLHLGPSNVDHIAANNPETALALIRRIRELEGVFDSIADQLEVERTFTRTANQIRALLEKGTTK